MKLSNSSFPFLLCVLPVALYIYFFERIALNINYIAYDDQHVLEIVNQWANAANWSERFHFLTVGFPEHRIVFTRSIVLISYWLTGGVKLINLMLLSNVLWVVQLFVLYQIFKPFRLSLWWFVPVCWLLLNVQSYENIFWGTSSLGNYGMLLFMVLAFYCYTLPTRFSFIGGLFFSIAATFSYGNGLVVFVIAIFFLLLTHQWKKSIITIIVFGLVMVIYQNTASNAAPAALNLTKLNSYPLAISCFFGFLGGSLNFNPNIYAETNFELWGSVVWGVFLVLITILFLKKNILTFVKSKFSKPFLATPTEQFLILVFLFICATALGLVYKRSGADFLPGMFKGRYKMYSTWLIVIVYFLFLNHNKNLNTKTLSSIFIGTIGLNLISLFWAIEPAVNNRRGAVALEFNSMHNADFIGLKMFDMTQKDFFRLQQLYRPEKPLNSVIDELKKPVLRTLQIDTMYCSNGTLIVVWHKQFLSVQKDLTDGSYVILKSKNNLYATHGTQHRLPLKTLLRRGLYWDKGFSAMFQGDAFNDGLYEMFVVLRQNGINTLYNIQPQLRVRRVGKQGFVGFER